MNMISHTRRLFQPDLHHQPASPDAIAAGPAIPSQLLNNSALCSMVAWLHGLENASAIGTCSPCACGGITKLKCQDNRYKDGELQWVIAPRSQPTSERQLSSCNSSQLNLAFRC